MSQFGGKDSKRHFTVVMDSKEHGLYVSSTPSSAAKKAVTKLCTANKSKKVEFYIREITQGSKKKTYGPYSGYIEKLNEPIKLKGRIIKHKPVAKLSRKKGVMKGGGLETIDFVVDYTKKGINGSDPTYKYDSSWRSGGDKLFFGNIFSHTELDGKITKYFPFVLYSDGKMAELKKDDNNLIIEKNSKNDKNYKKYNFPSDMPEFSTKMINTLSLLRQKIQPNSNTRQQNSRKLSNLYPKIAPTKIECTENIEDYIVSNNEPYKYDRINNQLFFGKPISEQFENGNKLFYPFSICIVDSNIKIIVHKKDRLYSIINITKKDDLSYLKKNTIFFNEINVFLDKKYQQILSNKLLTEALFNLKILGLSIDNLEKY